MADMLASGATWLSSQRRAHMSSNVTYRRGVSSVTVPATRGKTDETLQDGYGVLTHVMASDFIISASDLVLSSVRVEPQRGDTIEYLAADGSTHVYRVEPITGEECWSWNDPYHNDYRIHAKRDS